MSHEEDQGQQEYEQELWGDVTSENPLVRAKALLELSYVESARGNSKESLQMCYSAKELYEQLGRDLMKNEIATASRGIVINLDELNRPREAAEAAVEAVALLKAIDSEHVPDLLRRQGRLWFQVSEFQKSIDCHEEALSLPDLERSPIYIGIDHLNIGMCYHNKSIGNHQKAIEYLESAREIFRKEKDPRWVAECDGELAEVYVQLSMADEIQVHAQRALDVMVMTDMKRKEWFMNYFLAVAARLREEFDEAISYLEIARCLALQNGNEEFAFLVMADKELAEILIIKGRVNEANEILRRVKTVEEIIEGESAAA